VEPAPAREQRAAADPADQPVAEVVADDRARRRHDDHGTDRVMPFARENAEPDERRLARNGNAERLDQHDGEQKRQTVLGDEVRHRSARDASRPTGSSPASAGARGGRARRTAPIVTAANATTRSAPNTPEGTGPPSTIVPAAIG